MEVREESKSDRASIWSINHAAFETLAEANLVDALRARADPFISLVAEEQGEVVGHILFSPVTLEQLSEPIIMGLAPMAVRPDFQRQGIGSALVKTGLDRCRKEGVEVVVVLGHPEFYPKFGFVPASRLGIRCEYDAPDEAFMVVELQSGSLSEHTGLVRYHAAFAEL